MTEESGTTINRQVFVASCPSCRAPTIYCPGCGFPVWCPACKSKCPVCTYPQTAFDRPGDRMNAHERMKKVQWAMMSHAARKDPYALCQVSKTKYVVIERTSEGSGLGLGPTANWKHVTKPLRWPEVHKALGLIRQGKGQDYYVKVTS